jgi:hypothetical protein
LSKIFQSLTETLLVLKNKLEPDHLRGWSRELLYTGTEKQNGTRSLTRVVKGVIVYWYRKTKWNQII